MASTSWASHADGTHNDTDSQECSVSELGNQQTGLRSEHSPHAFSSTLAQWVLAYLQYACNILGFLGRCLPFGEMDQHHDERSANIDEPNALEGSSNFDDSEHSLEPMHKVFLSHSGAQKDFVEQLCKDLEGHDRYPFFDKRRNSLPIGEKFPKLIFDAIEQCRVGVVILSEEFLMSKWPMLELNAMVKELEKRESTMTIIPVFYRVSVESLKDTKNLHRWVRKWKQFAFDDKRINVEEWKKALGRLAPINSIVRREGYGDVKLREEIVMEVCKKVAMETRWDDSHVQGRVRICQVIKEKVKQVLVNSNVCIIGVYGVHGIGKSTMCKSLWNDLSLQFNDNVCHIEVGRNREMELLQTTSKTLTNANPKLLDSMTDVDKVYGQFKKKLKKCPIFLAVDDVLNESESLEVAERYLRVNYESGSVVLVTSTSLNVLKKLNLDESNCLEMPELKDDEARALLLDYANLPRRSQVDDILVEDLLKQCHFGKGDGRSKHFHPLALKVLGRQLGRNVTKWHEQLARIKSFNQLREPKHPIFSIFTNSFEALGQEYQELFMDLALIVAPVWERSRSRIYWLCALYNKAPEEMKDMARELKLKALLESDDINTIGMHDLWRKFALEKYKTGGSRSQHVIHMNEEESSIGKWRQHSNMVKNMCFFNEGWKCLNGLNLNDFVNIEALKIKSNIDMGDRVLDLDLSGLKHLKCLVLNARGLRVGVDGLKSLENLGFLKWKLPKFPPCFEEIGQLTNLQVLDLRQCNGIEVIDLRKLEKLRIVSIMRFRDLKAIQGLRSRLANLHYLEVSNCNALQECHGVGDLHALVTLKFSECNKLKELPFLGQLRHLKKLHLYGCNALMAILGLNDLMTLQKLYIRGCSKFLKLDLRKLISLEELDIIGSVEEVYGLDELTSLCLVRASFKKISSDKPIFPRPSNLKTMAITRWDGKIWKDSNSLVRLEVLFLYKCTISDTISSLEGLIRLKGVRLEKCSLKDTTILSSLIALKDLEIASCHQLEKLPEFKKLTNLSSLEITDCDNLGAWPSASDMCLLEELRLDGFLFLQIVGELGNFQKLQKLELLGDKCEIALSMACLSTLQNLKLEDFNYLKTLDLSIFLHLMELCLENNCALERITCNISLSTLKKLDILGCESLEEVVDLDMFPQLEKIRIVGCSALKRLTCS